MLDMMLPRAAACLEIMEALVMRSYVAANITAPSLFRVIEACKPTLLIDEADRFVKADAALNGIVNAGHSRRTAFVTRTEGNNGKYEVRRFSVWASQVIAGIGKQEDTLIDCSIRINLVR